MDGLPRTLLDQASTIWQQTLKSPIHCMGVGLHTGQVIRLILHPAEPGTGIVFRRTDVDVDIPAKFDCVVDTRLCTVLAAPGRPDIRIGTVEHVMAALAACGIDNALIAVDGPEIPVLDGSAAPFVFLIDCAGSVKQPQPRRAIEILHPVCVTDGEAFAEIRPAAAAALDLSVTIAFDAPAIGRQALSMRLGASAFRRHLASARTFALAADIAGLQAAGLAQGGSLQNAIVVDGARVLNPGGLRMADEFVRHKTLDLVGDLALAGAALHASVVAHRPGHNLNNRLLHALFANPAAWAWTDQAPRSDWTGELLQVAA